MDKILNRRIIFKTIMTFDPRLYDLTYIVESGESALNQERVLSSGTGISLTDNGANSTIVVSAASSITTAAIGVVIDGGGSAISTGVKGDLSIPFNCTINSVTLLSDLSGSIVIDIWRDSLANYPPTVADTITASAKPTLSSQTNSQDTTLTGWTTTINSNDTLRFNVDSADTVTRVTLILKVTKV